MPDMSESQEKSSSAIKDILGSVFMPIPLGFLAAPVIITALVAFGIYALMKDDVDRMLAPHEDEVAHIGFLFLAAILFSRLTLQLNFYPMEHKGKIMWGSSGNLRTNMSVYKALNKDGEQDVESPAIVMVSDGEAGKYNRANRSLTHFTETVPSFLLMLVLVGPVFPLPAFVIVALYAYGRVAHQKGEAEKYGNHGKGFFLSMLSGFVLEGLCWVCALVTFGVELPGISDGSM